MYFLDHRFPPIVKPKPLVVDPKYAKIGQLLEMFGEKRKESTQPHKYEDSHVTDMLDSGARVDGTNMAAKHLRNLLRAIKKDWIYDHPEDRM